MKLTKYNLLAIAIILFVSSCAYYNTFFNAKQIYEQAQKKNRSTKNVKGSGESKTAYKKTIKKCWKLIDFYGDSSKYADDALMLIGKSHYQLGEYEKAERIFEQFIPKYPDSKLVPEAKLWLARTYVKLDKDPLALNLLKNFFQENKTTKKIAAQVFYVLGELYIKTGEKEKAIESLNKCIKIADNDELAGGAQYLIAKNFFDLGEYENAIAAFKKTHKHELPVMQYFYSLMYQIDALDSLGRYDKSEVLLKKMLRDDRFKNQFGIIETRLVNVYERQKAPISFIVESYHEIMNKYKKTEGAALASFSLAQVFEYDLGKLDSAKFYYENVKKQYSRTEIAAEAESRRKLLNEYLKIHDQIVQDKLDLKRLAAGDSMTTVATMDSTKNTSENNPFLPKNTANNTNEDNINTNTETAGVYENKANQDKTNRKRPTINKNTAARKKKVKKAVKLRKPEEINKSLNKNSYALGEYFLLKYENYDSAEIAFKHYINTFEDSLLVPKALYSLYYLYSVIHKDTVKSDSIKTIIISDYPNTVYAKKLLGIKTDEKTPDLLQVELIKKFNTAEDLFSRQQYDEAVNTFLEIAGQDSADIYGEKSLYAVAYIYEKYIDNVDSAVYYYKKLMEEYPGTKYAKIAMAKTKEPPPEKSVSDSLAAASDSSVIVQSADTLKTGKGIVTEEKDNMDKDKKNVSGFKTGKLKGRIPENDKLK